MLPGNGSWGTTPGSGFAPSKVICRVDSAERKTTPVLVNNVVNEGPRARNRTLEPACPSLRSKPSGKGAETGSPANAACALNSNNPADASSIRRIHRLTATQTLERTSGVAV